MLIPVVSFVVFIVVNIGFAEAFGKGLGFALELTLLGFIFIPILAFGDDAYKGNSATA